MWAGRFRTTVCRLFVSFQCRGKCRVNVPNFWWSSSHISHEADFDNLTSECMYSNCLLIIWESQCWGNWYRCRGNRILSVYFSVLLPLHSTHDCRSENRDSVWMHSWHAFIYISICGYLVIVIILIEPPSVGSCSITYSIVGNDLLNNRIILPPNIHS